MIVKRNKPSITKIEGIFFYPGNNIIKKEDEDKLNKNEYFQHLLKTKIVGQPVHEIVVEGETKTVTDQEGNEVESEFAGLNAKEAIKVIKSTYSIPALEKLAETEERSSVIKAIDRQIKIIREE